MLNSSTHTPTDAELQQMVYGGEYHIPEPEKVQRHAEREQDADFARWEQELRPGTENDFVLGYDEIDPSLFSSEQPVVEHGQIAVAETDHRDEVSAEEKMHAIIERMAPSEQIRLIIDTGHYFVPNVRLQTVEMSKVQR